MNSEMHSTVSTCQHFHSETNPLLRESLLAHYEQALHAQVFPKAYTKLNWYCFICNKFPLLHDTWLCLSCQSLHCRSCWSRHRQVTHCEVPFWQMFVCNGSLYCTLCKDVMYNNDFELLHRQSQHNYLAQNNLPVRSWRPVAEELEKLPSPNLDFAIRRMFHPFRGLVNMGSTCYLSVLIQTLIQSPGLRTYLRNNVHCCASLSDCMKDVVCELTRLSNHVLDIRQDAPVVPRNLYEILVRFRPSLLDPVMHDTQEAFYALLQAAHKSLTNTSKEDCINSLEPCIIHELFCGHTMSQISYSQCGHIVRNDATPFTDLCVDVNTDSIRECLERFFSPVHVGERHCSQCRVGPQPAHKRDFIAKDPQLLVITLKRSLHTGKKIVKHVSFPAELDVSAYHEHASTSPSTFENKYELYAVVHHEGETSTSGHYFMFVNVGDRCWAKCNDEEVDYVPVTGVMRCNAYMLFYCKNSVHVTIPHHRNL